ncbi:MAG: radical SAM protein [Oscillospiraceae bacterium]
MEPRLGIYIHIPFCASKCGYCDFYSCAGAADRMADYQHALLEHIEESAGRIAPAYIDTVYFGGGTPSFYGAARLIELLDAVKATGRLLKRAEVTVEVNPDSVRLHDLRALHKAGFNRLSIGMQSANNDILKMIGRRHSFRQVEMAVQNARTAGLRQRQPRPHLRPAQPDPQRLGGHARQGDRPAPGAHLRLRAQA